MLLISAVPSAAADGPRRVATARAGDCLACHKASGPVLPGGHMATKEMKLADCMGCHEKDEVSLKSKIPTSHLHMLSGVSCQGCHGKKAPYKKMDYKGCLPCHSTETLAKAPARDHSLPNPHNSHYGTDVDCSLCHHQHKKSEFMCSQCHDFKNVTPSPLLPLKSSGAKVPEAPAKPVEKKEQTSAASPGASPDRVPGDAGKGAGDKVP